MKLNEAVSSVLTGLKGMADGAAGEARDALHRANAKMVDSMLDKLTKAPHGKTAFFSNLLTGFATGARKVMHSFRTWRTTFTGEWRKRAGDWLLKMFGKQVVWRWICTFHNSRDSHMTMHRQERFHGTPFISGAGNLLRYPGDRSAPIEEWINCQCYMIKVRTVKRK